VLEDFPAELQGQAAAALETERLSVEKGIDAWKKIVAAARPPGNPGASWPVSTVMRSAGRPASRFSRGRSRRQPGPAPSKVPVLLEMVELYRDRLKLDVMVVEVYNRNPGASAKQHRGDGRAGGPVRGHSALARADLDLAQKGYIVGSAEEKIALYLRGDPTWRSSRTGRGIKAFEAILRLMRGTPRPLTFLKHMYESGATGIDWWRVLRQEIARVGRFGRAGQALGEVAKLATEKLKKAAVVDRAVGQGPRGHDSDVEA